MKDDVFFAKVFLDYAKTFAVLYKLERENCGKEYIDETASKSIQGTHQHNKINETRKRQIAAYRAFSFAWPAHKQSY